MKININKLCIHGSDSNENNLIFKCLKRTILYINDDHWKDTYFVQPCFDIIYKDLLRQNITFKWNIGLFIYIWDEIYF